jgi:hypothetical protein
MMWWVVYTDDWLAVEAPAEKDLLAANPPRDRFDPLSKTRMSD